MDEFALPPANPAEIAAEVAMQPLREPEEFKRTTRDYQTLAALEHEADFCEFKDEDFFVAATRALSIPASFDATQPVTYRSFFDTMFEGTFRGYSKVMIGQIIGAGSVRAFCLNFEGVVIKPTHESPPDDHLFCVPALAVRTIDQTS